MASDATDPLLTPFTIKHLTLKNRIVSTSHEPSYTVERMPAERYRLYHEEKAKGGVGLTMFGGSCTVDIDSPAAFGNIDASTDAVIPFYADMVKAMHAHGCAVMNQITHLGRRTNWDVEHWLPIVSASNVREPAHRAFMKEAEPEDIARIAAAYGQAARRSRDGGLDGVEIESYGHLMDGFWSPATNKRDDAYGGSLDNRLRFAFEVLEQMRSACGDAFIIGVRMSIDEKLRDGFDESEGFEIARRLNDSGLVDFLSLVVGGPSSNAALSDLIPTMGTRTAPHLDAVARVRARLDLPVMHAARLGDLSTARHAVESGAVDLVGMTRAHMADPHIVAKLTRGEEDRIRPCVGAGYCIDQIYHLGAAYCLHNVATGREQTVPQLVEKNADAPKRIVVVGAGPAGLEAARVAAERGHDVVLFEAADGPGGQVAVAAQAPGRRDLIGVTDWLASECAHAGVDLRYGVYADTADVLAEAPDIVVIATGGVPNTDFIDNGADLVTTTWDALSGHARGGGSVIVYDENGREPGPTAAVALAEAGADVRYFTPDGQMGPDIGATNHPMLARAFYRHGVSVTIDRRLVGVRRDGNALVCDFVNDMTGEASTETAERVVVEYGTAPADGLYFDLKDGSANRGQIDQRAFVAMAPQPPGAGPDGAYRLYRVGDAVASRNIHAAIYESRRLALAF
jgi:2,4-dienoyl-CoA reductase-like NADH-dependent reductase (Old Yellow Enzyme family)